MTHFCDRSTAKVISNYQNKHGGCPSLWCGSVVDNIDKQSVRNLGLVVQDNRGGLHNGPDRLELGGSVIAADDGVAGDITIG